MQAKRNRDSYTDAETIQHYQRRDPLAHNRHLICDGELVDIWSQIQCDYRAQKCREGCGSKRTRPDSRGFENLSGSLVETW